MNKDIIIVVLSTTCFSLSIAYILFYNKIKRLAKELGRVYIDNVVMQEYIDILESKESNYVPDELVDKENFIKFLSDSRDWAYKYIEDVQDGLLTFVNGIEPEIAYFDEYGIVGDAYPHYHSMKKISQEYKELKKLLPAEGEQ
jgi:hypothetical protein